MAATLFVPSIGRKGRVVGTVTVHATVTNELDAGALERGYVTVDSLRVRSIEISEMLVDTGAATLGLPRFMIRSLGLRRLRDFQARTAAGEIVVGIYKDASLTIEGRTGTFNCLELADESAPLLGCIPMAFLGIEPDLKNRTIRLLPEWGPDSYFLT